MVWLLFLCFANHALCLPNVLNFVLIFIQKNSIKIYTLHLKKLSVKIYLNVLSRKFYIIQNHLHSVFCDNGQQGSCVDIGNISFGK
jgi:hypothetical protein